MVDTGAATSSPSLVPPPLHPPSYHHQLTLPRTTRPLYPAHAAGKDFARRVRGAEEPASLPVDGTEKGRTEKGRGAGTPSTSSPTSGGAVAAPGPEFYKPKHSRRGGSAVHLCDDARCELPPQDFWKRNGAGKGDPALAAARAHGRR